MTRYRSLATLMVALVVGTTFVSAAQAQQQGRGPRGFGGSRGSLLGLLSMEQVQKELDLNEELVAKVTELNEEARAEMRDQFAALRDMEDRAEQRTKMTELAEKADTKAREQLRDVLPREKMMRLYQIRMQVRATAESLANQYVARRLELTDDQKEKLAEISKGANEKRSELFSSMRDASQDQRSEAMQKFRQLRSDADEKALAVLTDDQKASFEEMKGEKIELEFRRGPR